MFSQILQGASFISDTKRITVICAAKDAAAVNEPMTRSPSLLWGNKCEQCYFIWKCVQPPHPPPLLLCLHLTKLKRRARLCIYFPLANQMFSFSPFPFFFGIVEHNMVVQAGSHCSAAMQYAFPLSHQNKEIQCLREQRGVSEDVGLH